MNSVELLTDYLKEEFPMLQEDLLPLNHSPHFLNIQIKDETNSNGASQKTDRIFKFLHSKADDIFVVMNVHSPVQAAKEQTTTTIDFNSVFKNQRCINRIELVEKPFHHPEKTSLKTFQYCVTCQVSSIRYQQIIEQCVNQDPALQHAGYMECFFINPIKHTVMHIYDREQLTVSSNRKRSLKKLEKNYKDSISEHINNQLATKQKIV